MKLQVKYTSHFSSIILFTLSPLFVLYILHIYIITKNSITIFALNSDVFCLFKIKKILFIHIHTYWRVLITDKIWNQDTFVDCWYLQKKLRNHICSVSKVSKTEEYYSKFRRFLAYNWSRNSVLGWFPDEMGTLKISIDLSSFRSDIIRRIGPERAH